MAKSLLEVLRDAAVDPAEQAVLEEIGATRYLARYGFDNVDPDDLREAVSLVADTLPPDVAQALPFSSEPVPGGGRPSSGLAESGGNPGAFADESQDVEGRYEAAASGAGSNAQQPDSMDPDTTLAFGAGSEPGAQGQPGVAHEAVVDAADDMLNGESGWQDTDLDMRPEISSDITHTADASVDVDATVDDADSFIDNFDDSAVHTALDDTAAPEDVGSF